MCQGQSVNFTSLPLACAREGAMGSLWSVLGVRMQEKPGFNFLVPISTTIECFSAAVLLRMELLRGLERILYLSST